MEFPSGLRVLFDPVFEHRCSPLGLLGPARYTKAPCRIEDIPTIDAVIISHAHYDHLSYPTVCKIHKMHPNAHFFAPLGNKKWFEKCNIHNMTEMDWWETMELKLQKNSTANGSEVKVGEGSDPVEIQATIGCLPCQHMAARTPFDMAQTLWSSWSVESGGKKVWFAGYVHITLGPVLIQSSNESRLMHCSFQRHGLPHCS